MDTQCFTTTKATEHEQRYGDKDSCVLDGIIFSLDAKSFL